MNIIRYQSANCGSRAGHVPDVIVCHITDGAFDGAVTWLCGKASGISSHFVVGRDGRVAQLVDLQNEAYCNGTQSTSPLGYEYVGRATAALVKARGVNANLYTVSVECEGDGSTHGILTDAQLAALAELIGYIRQQVKVLYGTDIPCDRTHLIGHCEIAPKEKPDCPGRDFPWDKLLETLNRLPARTHIDIPSGTVSGAFGVGGWGVHPSGAYCEDVYADAGTPKQQFLGRVAFGIERPDVDKAFPGYNKQPRGFQITVPAGKLEPGAHTIDAAVIGNDKTVAWAHVKFTVK